MKNYTKKEYNQKNKNNNTKVSNINYKVPEDKEKKISMNLIIGLFLFSSIIGFYLAK